MSKTQRAQWLQNRTADLLPVQYFHAVFNVPEPIARIAFHNRRTVYKILFRAAAQTLLTIARDPQHLGAEIGFFAILPTTGELRWSPYPGIRSAFVFARGHGGKTYCIIRTCTA